MSRSRLSKAAADGLVPLPEGARVAVFGPRAGFDLSALSHPHVIQTFRSDYDAFKALGFDVSQEPEGQYSAAVVCVPRAKDLAHAWIAKASAVAGNGLVVVDGQKLDGVDSILKSLRKRVEVGEVLSMAHGKLFAFTGGDFSDWADPGPRDMGGFFTQPGVFSADGVDRGSAVLAANLPALKGRVADLGAGWGYLAASILSSDKVTECHLIEAEARALACARLNALDPRVRLHWADATTFTPDAPFDVVVCNPPFHNTRAADPGLGRAFIASAARMLSPAGQLWLVANRHLPYEPVLNTYFRDLAEVGNDKSFKVLHAARPLKGKT